MTEIGIYDFFWGSASLGCGIHEMFDNAIVSAATKTKTRATFNDVTIARLTEELNEERGKNVTLTHQFVSINEQKSSQLKQHQKEVEALKKRHEKEKQHLMKESNENNMTSTSTIARLTESFKQEQKNAFALVQQLKESKSKMKQAKHANDKLDKLVKKLEKQHQDEEQAHESEMKKFLKDLNQMKQKCAKLEQEKNQASLSVRGRKRERQ